ncbi:MAG: PAS domain-containing sensor histidine kinase, partial [Cyanobacteria bacterium J06621_11]
EQTTAALLKESEEKFSTVFRNSPLPVTITSVPEGRFLNVNRAYIQYSGYTTEELIGKRVQDLDIWVDISDRTRLYELLQTQKYVHGFETQHRIKSGKVVDLMLFLDFVQLQGKPYLLTTGEDISARKWAKEKLEVRTQELSQALETLKTTQSELIRSAKMAALGNLVAGVAHEINTPVGTAIMTASTLENASHEIAAEMAAGAMKRSSFENYLEIATECSHLVVNNLQRAGELIQSFKQVAVDQSSLQKRKFLLKPYLQEVIMNLTPKFKGTAHQITLLGDENIALRSYPGAIAQVVTNLVVNSLTHAYPDGRAGHMVLAIEQQRKDFTEDALKSQPEFSENDVILRYSDDGCGITLDVQNRIFEPFYTTARDRGGSGLGLHLVYNLVTQKLEGTIEVTSVVATDFPDTNSPNTNSSGTDPSDTDALKSDCLKPDCSNMAPIAFQSPSLNAQPNAQASDLNQPQTGTRFTILLPSQILGSDPVG